MPPLAGFARTRKDINRASKPLNPAANITTDSRHATLSTGTTPVPPPVGSQTQHEASELQHSGEVLQSKNTASEAGKAIFPSGELHRLVEYSYKSAGFVPASEGHVADEQQSSTSLGNIGHLCDPNDPSSTGGKAAGANKAAPEVYQRLPRGLQTFHWPSKDGSTWTAASLLESNAGSCSPSDIYDAYSALEAKTKEDPTTPQPQTAPRATTATTPPITFGIVDTVERIMNQNATHDVLHDFKYWDDPADANRPDEGTLLPLWTFAAPAAARGRSATALAWNPKHLDLFAVGYGSYDFEKHMKGVVACHSMTRATAAEGCVTLPSGVVCLDFHPAVPSFLAVGCMDGGIHVVDFSAVASPRVLASTPIHARHTEPVWQLRWMPAGGAVTAGRPLTLLSASSDGKLKYWNLSSSSGRELVLAQDICLSTPTSTLRGSPAVGQGNSTAPSAITCFDMHPSQPSLLVLGTQEGESLRCALDVGPGSLQTYNGHSSPVYAIQWSPKHPTAFITAGMDWTVRVWDATTPMPAQDLLCFDLGAPVGDVAWAPFASTVFAAATDNGRVCVYDLARNRDAPLCQQKVVAHSRLTRLAFNPSFPVILVADDAGLVMCFKLSPNLRPKLTLEEENNALMGCEGRGRRGRMRRGRLPANTNTTDQATASTVGAIDGQTLTETEKEQKQAKEAAMHRNRLHYVLQIAKESRAAELAWNLGRPPSLLPTKPGEGL